MAGPPDTLDREAVEAALPQGVWETLPTLFRLCGVLPERWPTHDMLADCLPYFAVLALRESYREEGHSSTQALRLACGELGLGFQAVQRRLSRHRKRYTETWEKSVDKSSTTDTDESGKLGIDFTIRRSAS